MSTPNVVPAARPGMAREMLEIMLAMANVTDAVALVGRRGYYRDTMGAPGVQEVGIYDDAIALISPTAFVTFNANTDPSKLFPNVAVLVAGVWRYKIGTHGLSKLPIYRYKALVQAAPVTVRRWAAGPEADREETGYFGINVHRGGLRGTSSLGCQTIPPDQWPGFIGLTESELQRHNQRSLPYLLTEYAGIL